LLLASKLLYRSAGWNFTAVAAKSSHYRYDLIRLSDGVICAQAKDIRR